MAEYKRVCVCVCVHERVGWGKPEHVIYPGLAYEGDRTSRFPFKGYSTVYFFVNSAKEESEKRLRAGKKQE